MKMTGAERAANKAISKQITKNAGGLLKTLPKYKLL